MANTTRIMGLDLSLRATAMIAVPRKWGFDWSLVATNTVGMGLPKDATEGMRAGRLVSICEEILSFARQQAVDVAIIEQYAFTAMSSQAHALGELGGHVRAELLKAGISLESYPPQRARRLLGKQPRRDRKVWAAQRLYEAGCPKAWSGDEIDAFIQANHWLAENGGDALILDSAA